MDELIRLSRLAGEKVKNYPKKRFIWDDIIKFRNSERVLGISGSRGVGKTVILRQLLLESYDDSIYISLDTYEGGDLFGVLQKLNKRYGIQNFLLDEIHYYRGFSSVLKRIYDFTDLKIVFTSSMALIFPEIQADLSRRISLKKIPAFSFREYLFFHDNIDLPRLSFQDFLGKPSISKAYMGYEDEFVDYLKGGVFPFSLESGDVLEKLENVREVILRRDIPSTNNITIQEIQIMEDLLTFIGRSAIDGVNYSSLSDNLKITKYKARQYVEILQRAFLLGVVSPGGTNVRKEPKIMLALPFRLLYAGYENSIGQLREEFAVETLNILGIKFQYLKSNKGRKRPDYLLRNPSGNILVEIGGSGKGFSQFKGMDCTKYEKIIFSQNAVDLQVFKFPLYLMGFLPEKK